MLSTPHRERYGHRDESISDSPIENTNGRRGDDSVADYQDPNIFLSRLGSWLPQFKTPGDNRVSRSNNYMHLAPLNLPDCQRGSRTDDSALGEAGWLCDDTPHLNLSPERGNPRLTTPAHSDTKTIRPDKRTPLSVSRQAAVNVLTASNKTSHGSSLLAIGKATNSDSKTTPQKSTPVDIAALGQAETDSDLHLVHSCDPRIYLSLHGETIVIDLETLQATPDTVVQLLKIAQSEKANYMIAGAYYRRSGFSQNAKVVVEAMIHEFSSKGVPESSLKPAFLFLFSCEMDLAKAALAANQSPSTSAAHNRSAQQWLQKVYGKANPSRNEDDKENLPPVPTSSEPQEIVPRHTPRKSSPTRPWHGETKVLKREIQSLRDRNKNQSKQLDEMNTSKRRLEEDYRYERNLRRKCQDRIKTLEEERDSARKLEAFALEQFRREVAKREEN